MFCLLPLNFTMMCLPNHLWIYIHKIYIYIYTVYIWIYTHTKQQIRNDTFITVFTTSPYTHVRACALCYSRKRKQKFASIKRSLFISFMYIKYIMQTNTRNSSANCCCFKLGVYQKPLLLNEFVVVLFMLVTIHRITEEWQALFSQTASHFLFSSSLTREERTIAATDKCSLAASS